MLVLRSLTAVPRSAARTAVRAYSVHDRVEGSVAQSQGFNKKEKAHEDQYVRKHEADQLKKLKASIEAKKAELSALEGQREALENGQKK